MWLLGNLNVHMCLTFCFYWTMLLQRAQCALKTWILAFFLLHRNKCSYYCYKEKQTHWNLFFLLALPCPMQTGWATKGERAAMILMTNNQPWNKPVHFPPGRPQAGTSGIADPEQGLISWWLFKQCTREQSAFKTKNRRMAPNKISRTLREQIPPLHRP